MIGRAEVRLSRKVRELDALRRRVEGLDVGGWSTPAWVRGYRLGLSPAGFLRALVRKCVGTEYHRDKYEEGVRGSEELVRGFSTVLRRGGDCEDFAMFLGVMVRRRWPGSRVAWVWYPTGWMPRHVSIAVGDGMGWVEGDLVSPTYWGPLRNLAGGKGELLEWEG